LIGIRLKKLKKKFLIKMTTKKERIRHKAQLNRLLSGLLDNKKIESSIFFKGGTCCAMLGYLDRFSVDLDFDLKKGADKEKLRQEFHSVFKEKNLEIKDESKKVLQFFLKYEAPPNQRNTLKVDVLDKVFKNNEYESQYLESVDRTANCQTIETMFAHKLVALKDRYSKHQTIAPRDVYDIHHFFINGYDYKKELIQERTGKKTLPYLKELVDFIKEHLTQEIINQKLGPLLSNKKFQAIRKSLKTETIFLIKEEIKRLR